MKYLKMIFVQKSRSNFNMEMMFGKDWKYTHRSGRYK